VGYRNASAFGTTYTASNGLTLSGSDFQLGGTLTGNTTIAADNKFLFIDSANQFSFSTKTSASQRSKIYSAQYYSEFVNHNLGYGGYAGIFNSIDGTWQNDGVQNIATLEAATASVSNSFDATERYLKLRSDSIFLKKSLNSVYVGDNSGTSDSALVRDASTGLVSIKKINGVTPTLQQVLTAGSTLTQDNTIVNDANTLTITGNTVAGDAIVSITSTSTAAASNLQKGINVSLSGANATAAQSTYGGYFSNVHTGSGNTRNYGSFFNASGSGFANYGVFSQADGGAAFAIYGDNNGTGNGTGVYGQSVTGIGVFGVTSGAGVGVQGSNDIANGIAIKGATALSSAGTSIAINGTATGSGATTNIAGKFTASGGTNNYAIQTTAGALQIQSGRILLYQGADVASAAGAIAVGNDGNVFELTGTAAVTLISNLNWQNGAEITLVFTSTATLTDGTANSGTDIGMELAGNANFVGSADDVITLVLTEVGGTQRWREKSRSVN